MECAEIAHLSQKLFQLLSNEEEFRRLAIHDKLVLLRSAASITEHKMLLALQLQSLQALFEKSEK